MQRKTHGFAPQPGGNAPHIKKPGAAPQPGGLLQGLFWSEQSITPAEPVLHINCRGCAELENCRSVLVYEPTLLRFCVGEYLVDIRGQGLTILSLNRDVTQLSGKIETVSFTERQTDAKP